MRIDLERNGKAEIVAGFRTHITVSSLLGVGYGAAGTMAWGMPVPTSILAGGLCGVAGMLPDLDSDSGVPLRESIAFAAAVVPMMLVERFEGMGYSHETIVLIGGAVYFAVRYGMAAILKHGTVHRGMFHSLPAAAIFGLLAFWLCSGGIEARYYKSFAIVAGFVSHLLLDEIYSIEWTGGRLRLKKSFGTALKLFSGKIIPDAVTYSQLLLIGFVVVNDPIWLDAAQKRTQVAENPPAATLLERFTQHSDSDAVRR